MDLSTKIVTRNIYLKRNVLLAFSTARRFQQKEKSTIYEEKKIRSLTGLPIIHHHGYVCSLPEGHRFPMRKFDLVLERLVTDGVINPKKQVIEPLQVSSDVPACVHTKDYVDKFFTGKTSHEEQRVTGFVWTPGLASRVRYETGGTLLTAQIALQRGLACSTAGGTHHAFPDHGAGFCLINDLAVTAQYLIDNGTVDKVLIVDLDVHQGDGTAYIFRENPNVFTFSMHCGQNYPFRKQRSDLDVILRRGEGDDKFLTLLQGYLPFILSSFKPDLVLYDAGVDPHELDSLGYLRMTDNGLLQRDQYVLETVLGKGIPCATVIGGGYDRDLSELARRHTFIHRAATKVHQIREL